MARPAGNGFEAQFSWLRRHGNHEAELSELVKTMTRYFESLALPEQPTIYDYLVLGLRPKDLIATFNWDPLLMQAYRRNRHVADLPDLVLAQGLTATTTVANATFPCKNRRTRLLVRTAGNRQ
jgi:hypothetical protein